MCGALVVCDAVGGLGRVLLLVWKGAAREREETKRKIALYLKPPEYGPRA